MYKEPDTVIIYDGYYKSQLAIPGLNILIQDIYRKRSRLVVVFLCESYQQKSWCGIEYSVILEMIMDKKNSQIMYIKLDDGQVDGVLKTDGYIDGTTHNSEEIAKFILERITLLNRDVARI